MIGIIVDNEDEKAPHVENLIKNGYATTKVADLYVKGKDEVLLLTRGMLSMKETLYLDFMPQIGCKLTHLELKVVDYIRLRHLSGIQVITPSKDPFMSQLWS